MEAGLKGLLHLRISLLDVLPHILYLKKTLKGSYFYEIYPKLFSFLRGLSKVLLSSKQYLKDLLLEENLGKSFTLYRFCKRSSPLDKSDGVICGIHL